MPATQIGLSCLRRLILSTKLNLSARSDRTAAKDNRYQCAIIGSDQLCRKTNAFAPFASDILVNSIKKVILRREKNEEIKFETMKCSVGLLVLATCAIFVQSLPVDRHLPDAPSIDFDEYIEYLLKALEDIVKDGVTKQDIIDIIFPPIVSNIFVTFSDNDVQGDTFQITNVINVPIVCEEGYKYYMGKCRRVFSLPGLNNPGLPNHPFM